MNGDTRKRHDKEKYSSGGQWGCGKLPSDPVTSELPWWRGTLGSRLRLRPRGPGVQVGATHSRLVRSHGRVLVRGRPRAPARSETHGWKGRRHRQLSAEIQRHGAGRERRGLRGPRSRTITT